MSNRDGPRVTFEIKENLDGFSKNRELPFVVGVLADLSGNAPTGKPKSLKELKPIDIHSGNLDEEMGKMGVGVRLKDVPKVLSESDGTKENINVTLEFKSMADFDVPRVAEQIPGIRELVQMRTRLMELQNRIGDPEVDDILKSIMESTELQGDVKKALPTEVEPKKN